MISDKHTETHKVKYNQHKSITGEIIKSTSGKRVKKLQQQFKFWLFLVIAAFTWITNLYTGWLRGAQSDVELKTHFTSDIKKPHIQKFFSSLLIASYILQEK